MSVVITNPEMGIYLGCCMGMGFWSKLDPVGQPSAVTFPSAEEARKIASTWESTPADLAFVNVVPDDGGYASVAACVAAGLDPWTFDEPAVADSPK